MWCWGRQVQHFSYYLLKISQCLSEKEWSPDWELQVDPRKTNKPTGNITWRKIKKCLLLLQSSKRNLFFIKKVNNYWLGNRLFCLFFNKVLMSIVIFNEIVIIKDNSNLCQWLRSPVAQVYICINYCKMWRKKTQMNLEVHKFPTCCARKAIV